MVMVQQRNALLQAQQRHGTHHHSHTKSRWPSSLVSASVMLAAVLALATPHAAAHGAEAVAGRNGAGAVWSVAAPSFSDKDFLCPFNGSGDQCRGTREYIHEVFMGRCFDFIHDATTHGPQGEDCFAMWELFSDAVLNAVDGNFDFRPLLQKANLGVDSSHGVLWSGLDLSARAASASTRSLQDALDLLAALSFSDFDTAIALERTHIGYVLDNITFCANDGSGQTPAPVATGQGFNYDCCVWENGAVAAFWKQASDMFASFFNDSFHILINYRDGCEFGVRSDSVLAHEIDQIQKCRRCAEGHGEECNDCTVHVWVLSQDKCDSDRSLKHLKKQLQRLVVLFCCVSVCVCVREREREREREGMRVCVCACLFDLHLPQTHTDTHTHTQTKARVRTSLLVLNSRCLSFNRDMVFGVYTPTQPKKGGK